MPKIKWKSKDEIESEKAEQEAQKAGKKRFKGKTLTVKDRNDLLEQMAKDLGYL